MIKIYSPLEQFEVVPLFLNISNVALATIWMVVGIILIIIGATSEGSIINKTAWKKLILDLTFTFFNLTKNQIHSQQSYFGFIFSLFICIILVNLIGLIPYSYTITSHVIINLGLSLPLFIMIVLTGLTQYKLNFFILFVPSGAPAILLPLITLIEFVSFMSRPISLTVRLTSNLISGHLILKLFAGATWYIITSSLFILSFIPFMGLVAFGFLELGVACIQAYVFVLLTAIYLNEMHELSEIK